MHNTLGGTAARRDAAGQQD